MAKREHPIMLIVLVFATLALFGNTQVWAECPSPCESVRIYPDEFGNEKLKTIWDPCTCVFVAAYICQDSLLDGECEVWGDPLALEDAYVCIGPPEPTTDPTDIPANCSLSNAGPRSSGCVLRNYCYWIGRRLYCR